ncbi:MAG TPA: hypothetical protein VGJ73_09430 [Verrucomicrobiae bacterium]|jgi:hypothetical protein
MAISYKYLTNSPHYHIHRARSQNQIWFDFLKLGNIFEMPLGHVYVAGIVVMKECPNHCCPGCGHLVGAKRWFWRAWIWARWNCESCGIPLRFDFRRRLLFVLFVSLSYLTAFGIAFACMAFRISPWIWTVPLLATLIFSLILALRHGDRIAVAVQNKKTGSHALSNDAAKYLAGGDAP